MKLLGKWAAGILAVVIAAVLTGVILVVILRTYFGIEFQG